MSDKEWTFNPSVSVLTHSSGLKLHILSHRNNEITEMTPQIPHDMDRLEAISLIRAGATYFRKNYHSLIQPKKQFDSTLSLKR